MDKATNFNAYHKGTTIFIQDNNGTKYRAPAFMPSEHNPQVMLCFEDAAYLYYINGSSITLNSLQLSQTPQPLPAPEVTCNLLREGDIRTNSTGDVNNPDAILYLLAPTPYFLPERSATKVYGTSSANNINFLPQAKAVLNAFAGQNTLGFFEDKVDFDITRSGTQVTLKSKQGTLAILAATRSLQRLDFPDEQTVLRIEQNDIYLGDSPIPLQGQPNDKPTNSRNLPSINPTVSGTLYYNSPDAFVAFDLALGTDFGLAPKSYGASIRNTNEFILIENEKGYDESDRLVIRDQYGFEKKSFPLGLWQWGAAKSTPNGKYIALARKPTSQWQSKYDTPVAIFDENGNVIKRYYNVDSYDISATGELFMVKYGNLYTMGHAPFNNGTLLTHFPDSSARSIEVDPKGQKVTFSAVGGDGIRHIYVMNLDGKQLRQLTTSNNDTKSEGSPTWSPDGNHIAFVYGESLLGCFNGLCYSECPRMIITPAHSNQIANITANDMSPAFIPYQRTEQGKIRHTCAFSPPKWGKSPDYPYNAGTVIDGGGANYGLKGTLLSASILDFKSLDLWTGASKKERESGDSIELSHDKTHFYGSFDKSGLYDVEQVKRFDLNGNETYLFNIPDHNYGPTAASPDGKYLAIGHYYPEDTLTIYSSTFRKENGRGLALKRFSGEFGGWQWRNDGSLLYAQQNAIYAHPKNFLFNESSKLITLPDSVKHLALSPDESKYAFKMGLHIWTVNVNGSNLKQLTISNGYDNYPTWSNDGKVILVTHFDDVNSPRVYAVPSDGERVYLGHTNLPTNARRLYSAEFGGIHAAARGRLIWKQ
ncbi:MAG: hypothetical protein MI864_04615 [Pseudomonadales bacterium]|nr:hypothetical protein [Pseudomonadales bacterium]